MFFLTFRALLPLSEESHSIQCIHSGVYLLFHKIYLPVNMQHVCRARDNTIRDVIAGHSYHFFCRIFSEEFLLRNPTGIRRHIRKPKYQRRRLELQYRHGTHGCMERSYRLPGRPLTHAQVYWCRRILTL